MHFVYPVRVYRDLVFWSDKLVQLAVAASTGVFQS